MEMYFHTGRDRHLGTTPRDSVLPNVSHNVWESLYCPDLACVQADMRMETHPWTLQHGLSHSSLRHGGKGLPCASVVVDVRGCPRASVGTLAVSVMPGSTAHGRQRGAMRTPADGDAPLETKGG